MPEGPPSIPFTLLIGVGCRKGVFGEQFSAGNGWGGVEGAGCHLLASGLTSDCHKGLC
jgi:hypothetical protein